MRLAALALALLVVLAGCVSGSPSVGESPGTTDTSSDGNSDTTECQRTPVQPPDELTEANALSTAAAYEERVARNRICDYAEAGLESTTAPEITRVESRLDDGYVVFAQQPYWYSSGEAEADGATSGVYLFTGGTAERVPEYGAESWPVEAFAGNETGVRIADGVDLKLYNFGDRRVNVNISIGSVGDAGPEPVRYETDVPEHLAVHLRSITRYTGTYRVSVETGSGHTEEYRFTVSKDRTNPVAVYLLPDGRVRFDRFGA